MTGATTFTFGELETGRFGLARLVSGEPGSGRAALFAGGELVAAGDSVVAQEESRASFTADGGGFELEFAGIGEPVALAGAEVQLCRVTGQITIGGATERIDCLGQRSTEAGAANTALVRLVGAWISDDEAILARAARPAGAAAHDADTLEVFVFEGEPPTAVSVADPRLSTQYDADGAHVRAGLELWVTEEDDYARRVAGEVVCATGFDLEGARLDCAFLRWRTHGREGAGVYDLLRTT